MLERFSVDYEGCCSCSTTTITTATTTTTMINTTVTCSMPPPAPTLVLTRSRHASRVYVPINDQMTNCNGGGQCGTCAVQVEQAEGWDPRSDWEAGKLKVCTWYISRCRPSRDRACHKKQPHNSISLGISGNIKNSGAVRKSPTILLTLYFRGYNEISGAIR